MFFKTRISPASVCQAFRPGGPKAFHDLWHTAATMMLKDGVNVKIVSEVLGHARGMCCPACRRRSETGVDEV